MRGARLALVALIVAAVVALTAAFDGSPPAGRSGLEAPPVPAAGTPEALSSTWFCAAGSAGTPNPPRHDLFLFNPSGQETVARLTAFGPEGPVGEREVPLTAPGPTRVDVQATFEATGLSVMVESVAGDLVVEHRLLTPSASDQVPCATTSSDRWYFPAQTTVRETTAQLHLFNPFTEDASVDISAAVDDGLREPPEWQGLVVPAGSTEVVDLGVGAQRRDQFAVTVQARNGRVIAETVQYLNTTEAEGQPARRGLRLQLGVPAARADWAFAQGFTGPGVRERLVLFNPGERAASAVVQATPHGAAALAPEPFELEVPALRYVELDLSAETRLPGEGLHSIRVQTDEQTPLVVARVLEITGERADPTTEGVVQRPPVARGSSVGTGSPVVATVWATTGLAVGEPQESLVAVHNPNATPVVATATVFGGEGDTTALADEVEIPAGESLAITTAGLPLGSGVVSIVVEASSPVVVERTITYVTQNDLAVGSAVPLPTSSSPLRPLGPGS